MTELYRFATFNTALHRSFPQQLVRDLSTPHHPQAQKIAEIIQRVQPSVLLLQEFDYDPRGKALRLFQKNYLQISQNGATPCSFQYYYLPSSNTGLDSGYDLDHNNRLHQAGDAFGYGYFPGQYGFLLLSKYPIHWRFIRSFQTFLWKDLPQANSPRCPTTGQPWYSPEEWAVFRLSSKNHIDVPIKLPSGLIHVLAAHPTPPVFDGPERRNALRNYDEIRLLTDYITPHQSYYLYDDKGKKGGLPPHHHFILMGDFNADPKRGNSLPSAIQALLTHPRLHPAAAQGDLVPKPNPGYNLTEPSDITTSWGLRVDYVLPSRELNILNTGLFWPAASDPLSYLLTTPHRPTASSDHRLVWVDFTLPLEWRL